MEIIGFLGPQGSYSGLAAQKFCKNAERRAYRSFALLMQGLACGECSAAAFPIENSLNGSVTQVMDLLQYTEGVIASECLTLRIDHRLAYLNGADIKGISRIYSHAQALEQCGRYIFENFPNARTIETFSTAAGLDMLKTHTDACIAGAHVKREGVVLSQENIADEKNNFTAFLLVRKGTATDVAKSQKIYFSAVCRHKAGALSDLLRIIKDGGLNMTKIQSRPVKESVGDYRFFIEAEGNVAEGGVKKALSEVQNFARSFKILGLY